VVFDDPRAVVAAFDGREYGACVRSPHGCTYALRCILQLVAEEVFINSSLMKEQQEERKRSSLGS